MTALAIIAAVILLALVSGEQGDFWNMKAGHKSAPPRARFAAGLIVVVGVALFVALWQLSRLGGSPAP